MKWPPYIYIYIFPSQYYDWAWFKNLATEDYHSYGDISNLYQTLCAENRHIIVFHSYEYPEFLHVSNEIPDFVKL